MPAPASPPASPAPASPASPAPASPASVVPASPAVKTVWLEPFCTRCRRTVTGVETVIPLYVAVTFAVPAMNPPGVSTPVDAAMLPISPRSIENDAATTCPPIVAVYVAPGVCEP